MNPKLPLVALAMVLTVTGCQSVNEAATSVREKIGPRDPPHVRTYAALPRATYDAVKIAAAQMGYRFVRGGPAQGEYEALSGLLSGDTQGSARQISMKVKLRPTLDEKGTEVTVRLTEIIEADSTNRAGMATETPLRDTPQYEVFLRRVQENLLPSANPAK